MKKKGENLLSSQNRRAAKTKSIEDLYSTFSICQYLVQTQTVKKRIQ